MTRSLLSATGPLLLVLAMSAGCASNVSTRDDRVADRSMMMTDRSVMMSDGTLMVLNDDGTTRVMTDAEMSSHVSMMMRDPRAWSMVMAGTTNRPSKYDMVMDRCKAMKNQNVAVTEDNMMMIANPNGTMRAMTDAEFRQQLEMMLKHDRSSKLMMEGMLAHCANM